MNHHKVRLVQVGNRRIPVVPHYPTLVRFAAGAHGKRERGTYAFWHISGEDEFGEWGIFGRARESLSPGDRFDRMKFERLRAESKADRKAYARMFALAQTGAIIRPASMREVAAWMSSHQKDAVHITGILWKGHWYKRLPKALR